MKNSTPIVKDTLNIRPVLLAIISFEFDFLPIYNKKQRTKDGNIPNQRIKILKSLISSYVIYLCIKTSINNVTLETPQTFLYQRLWGFCMCPNLHLEHFLYINRKRSCVFYLLYSNPIYLE